MDIEDFLIGVLTGGLIVAVFVILSLTPREVTYKQGQIDALTGKAKYHLVVKADSTRVWEPITK